MSTFRDAIAQAISDEQSMMMGATPDMDVPKFNAGDAQCAWGVLAMPEMEAIRKALLLDTICECDDPIMCGCDMQLPVSVIAWVLGGDQ